MSLTMYIHCLYYMFRPHMGHHQATLIVWGDHCTVHFDLSTLSHIAVVVNLLRRTFSSCFFFIFLAAVSVFIFSV
jgi:hypothetical protein